MQYILGMNHLLYYPDQMKRHVSYDAAPDIAFVTCLSITLNLNKYAISQKSILSNKQMSCIQAS